MRYARSIPIFYKNNFYQHYIYILISQYNNNFTQLLWNYETMNASKVPLEKDSLKQHLKSTVTFYFKHNKWCKGNLLVRALILLAYDFDRMTLFPQMTLSSVILNTTHKLSSGVYLITNKMLLSAFWWKDMFRRQQKPQCWLTGIFHTSKLDRLNVYCHVLLSQWIISF